MKYQLLLCLALITSVAFGFHGSHHSSHSSHHSSHSSGHTAHHSYHVSHGSSHSYSHHSSVHPYTHVSHLNASEIHMMHPSNNTMLYYYLLHNNHTNTNDTITAPTVTELEAAVNEVSEEPETISGETLCLIIVCVVLFVGVALFLRD